MYEESKGYSENIKKYAVKINYEKYTLSGSGVLVKIDDNTCYLITAKHNFKAEGKDTFSTVNIEELKLNLDKIKIFKDDKELAICTISELVYEKANLDLIVFSVTVDSNYIQNLPSIKILKEKYPLKEYFFYGYPNDGEGTPIEKLDRPTYSETEKHHFRLSGVKNPKEKSLKGFSGSGLFTENDSIFYLVGIVIKVDEKLSFYKCIDLSKIIDEINTNINPKIEIEEDVIDISFSQNIYTRLLNRNKNTSLVQKILNKVGKNNKTISFLKINNEKREELISFLDMDKEQLLKLEKELADLYLLKAIIYDSDTNQSEAGGYLKKAIKFNSRFRNYKLERLANENIDEVEDNEKFTPLEKAELYSIKENYDKAIEYFKKALDGEEVSTHNRIEIYTHLSKIYKKLKEEDTAKEYYAQTLKIYDENHILEKAEIYYELSLLSEKEEALVWLDEGVNLVNKNNSSELLDIRYKLEKYRDKLLETESKTINQTLIQLAKMNPEKYLKEFLEEYSKRENSEITNYDIYSKIEELHQDVKGIKNNEKKNQPL